MEKRAASGRLDHGLPAGQGELRRKKFLHLLSTARLSTFLLDF
jgi:hypothetical protein